MYGLLDNSGYRVLEFLYNHSTKDHNLNDISAGISHIVPSYEIEAILNVFHQSGYITMLFTVDDVLDVESKAENRYKITKKGEMFFLEQQGFIKYGHQATSRLEEEYPDAEEEKRKRRNMIIGFVLILILALAAVILIPIFNN